MTLTKAQIVENIRLQNGMARNRSTEIVETLLELIKKSLENDGEVLISGFGKFTVREKGKRRGRNPVTGDDMMLKPRKVVTFKWSGRLKEKVNKTQ